MLTEPRSPAHSATNQDILIIDDNIDDVELCHRMLCGAGLNQLYANTASTTFTLRHATSGEQGLREINTRLPHCVLLDYFLPGNNGLAVLADIHQQHPQLPVIVLTGQGNEKLAVELLKAGAQDYIAKADIIHRDLRHIVLGAIQQQGASRRVQQKAQPYKVLVIDDSEDDRELVRRSLFKAAANTYQVNELVSGARVLDYLEKYQPACVLLDYSLPGASGIEVLKTISEHQPFTVVILFSGQGSEAIAAEAIKHGAYHYLNKAELNPELLHSTLQQGIENKRLEQLAQEKNRALVQQQQRELQRQKRYDRVVQATQMIVWEYDIHRDQLDVDEHINQVLGEPPGSEWRLAQLRQRVHPNDLDNLQQQWQAHLRTGSELDVEYRILCSNGSWCWLRETGSVVAAHNQQPKEMVGVYENINQRKREEVILHKLHSFSLSSKLSSQQKIAEVLRLGLSYYGLEVGVVAQIKADRYQVLHAEPPGSVPVGQIMQYSRTYCSQVFGSDQVKSWHRAGQSDIRHHPCFQDQQLETYIGTTLFCDQAPYGTLCFTQAAERQPFSTREKVFLGAMAQALSAEITRNAHIKEIEQSNQFLQVMQDAIPDLISVKDEFFNTVLANKAHKEASAAVQRTATSEQAKHLAGLSLASDKLALLSGYTELEEQQHSPSGPRTLHTKKTRFENTTEQTYVLSISRDISERKQAERQLAESEQRYQLAVQGSAVGLWDWQIHSDQRFWSARFRQILGISEDKTANSYAEFLELVYPQDRTKVEQAMRAHLENKQPYSVEFRVLKNSGQLIWVHSRGQAEWDTQGKAMRMAGSINDITAAKAALEEALRSNAELERFAYVASHDLQEPMRMVANFTQLLEQRYHSVFDERGLEYLKHITRSANTMQALVKGLLAYARVGNPAESIEEVNLNQIKHTVEQNLLSSIQQSEALIEWPQELPTIHVNPVHICSLWQNLIGNAIKYKKPAVAPHITITYQACGEHWLFSVADNGLGMKQAYCGKIFEPFKRLHRDEHYAGIGMGLAICRKIVEELGGKIWVESELGVGSTFFFNLPK